MERLAITYGQLGRDPVDRLIPENLRHSDGCTMYLERMFTVTVLVFRMRTYSWPRNVALYRC